MRALKKNLKDRYPTAKELGQALGYQQQKTQQPAQPRPSRASLVVLQGPRQGQRIPLTSQPLALGRFDLGSSNTAISRRHASIVFRGGSYWLEDMSKNGTWIDNMRVYGEAPLRPGATIVIGENVLRLEQVSA